MSSIITISSQQTDQLLQNKALLLIIFCIYIDHPCGFQAQATLSCSIYTPTYGECIQVRLRQWIVVIGIIHGYLSRVIVQAYDSALRSKLCSPFNLCLIVAQ